MGYALLCAVELSGTADMATVPDSFPRNSSQHTQLWWVQKLAKRIVDMCWNGPLTEDMWAVSQSHTSYTHNRGTNLTPDDQERLSFCICQTGQWKIGCNINCWEEFTYNVGATMQCWRLTHICKQILRINVLSKYCYIAVRCILHNNHHEKRTLLQVTPCWCKGFVRIYYRSQCWPRSMSQYTFTLIHSVTR